MPHYLPSNRTCYSAFYGSGRRRKHCGLLCLGPPCPRHPPSSLYFVANSALSDSKTVKSRSAVVRAIAAVSLACDDVELDIADVVAFLRAAYSSDNYLVSKGYIEVLGKLLLKHRCSDRLYLNILPAYLSLLGEDCEVPRKKAEHYWEKAASVVKPAEVQVSDVVYNSHASG